MKKAVQILKDARSRISRDTWIRQAKHQGAASCAIGYLETADGPEVYNSENEARMDSTVIPNTGPEIRQAVCVLAHVIAGERLHTRPSDFRMNLQAIYQYNDYQCSDADELADKFDRAITILDSQKKPEGEEIG
jgi:hypothetical protein